jgi:hypothetical protein
MRTFVARIMAVALAGAIAQNHRRKRRTLRKSKSLYSKSEKNAIIDSVIHPWADEHWGIVIVDGVLYALNEQDPVESFVKFLKFNAPELVKRILKEIR